MGVYELAFMRIGLLTTALCVVAGMAFASTFVINYAWHKMRDVSSLRDIQKAVRAQKARNDDPTTGS